ncbi:hypothetical protein LTR17_025980 [Elasticomyces elasticus]|nr:hypothetical protein LTR17_025980 [Elasticomyces elasticus]
MGITLFHFAGEDAKHGLELDSSHVSDLEVLKQEVANHFGVVVPEEIGFQSKGAEVEELTALQNTFDPVAITVGGHAVRDVPGPEGLPWVGNYFEVFPDHLGNNLRLFEKYGGLFKTTSFGSTTYLTNDPVIAQIGLSETEFFSKVIVPNHPLYPIKTPDAGVFLADSTDPSWKIVHKFMPPALGPKAVRHYAPIMNQELRMSLPVFDELESRDEAWNVYQFMLKLSSATVGKIMLGKDFGHFTSVDAPMNKMPLGIAEALALNKKISTKGDWYSHLPFGDPKRLKDVQQFMLSEIEASIEDAKATFGTEDLPLQDAALKAANVIDYFVRAVDAAGERLPLKNLVPALVVASGAGFTTTSSLLSWLIYGLVAYPGMQERLVQELVDKDFSDGADVTPELIEELSMLDKYVKEMQRRHNPSYQPGRTAQKDLVLPGGLKMYKGDVLIIALHHLHMNPKIWDNPDHFDPDRWDTERVKKRSKTEHIPFAYGGRMCIGFNFALQEVKIFLVQLVWRYQWFKDGEVETEYDPWFQLIRPVNLYVRTQRRTEYPSKSDAAQS